MELFKAKHDVKDSEVKGFSTPEEIDQYIAMHKEDVLVLGAYLFDTVGNLQVTEKDINLSISYVVQFNHTRTQSSTGEIWNPYNEVMLPMQYFMDTFLMKWGGLDGTGNSYDLSVLLSEFPHDPLLTSDFFASYGFVFVFLLLGIIMGLFLMRLAKDFRTHHRESLILFGVSDTAYFTCIFGKDMMRIITGTAIFVAGGVGSADMCAFNNHITQLFVTIVLFASWSWLVSFQHLTKG
jgi:hypothetical protein